MRVAGATAAFHCRCLALRGHAPQEAGAVPQALPALLCSATRNNQENVNDFFLIPNHQPVFFCTSFICHWSQQVSQFIIYVYCQGHFFNQNNRFGFQLPDITSLCTVTAINFEAFQDSFECLLTDYLFEAICLRRFRQLMLP